MKIKLLKPSVTTPSYLLGTVFVLMACIGSVRAADKPDNYLKEKTHLSREFSLRAMAEVTVTGTITEENGTPIPGATVSVPGTSIGTVTDLNGQYTLTVPEGRKLMFSFVGFVSQTVEVGDQSIIDIVLTEDTAALDEVVVTALGIQRDKKALTYATGELKGTDFLNARETNLGTALSAKIAGVQVTTSSSGMSGSSRVIIRGNSSLSGNSQPLYVIDGMPIDNSNRRSLGSQTFGSGLDGGTASPTSIPMT